MLSSLVALVPRSQASISLNGKRGHESEGGKTTGAVAFMKPRGYIIALPELKSKLERLADQVEKKE